MTKHAVDLYSSLYKCPDKTEVTVCGQQYRINGPPGFSGLGISDTVDVCVDGMDAVTCEECILLLFEKSANMKEGSERCKCGATCSYADGADSKCDGEVESLLNNEYHICLYHNEVFRYTNGENK